MLFDLKPGDKVRFTNYLGEGIVFKVDGDEIVVEDENGLVLHLTWKDVVPIFKPEKDLPTYRAESKQPQQKPTQEKKSSENITSSPGEFDWESKPHIKKVKDKSAGIKDKDSTDAPEVRDIQTDEETGIPEIDLHLHELLENQSGMDDYDKLQYQLNHLKKELRRLNQLHKKEAIIIHGVGKGKLRNEVWNVLSELSFLADFYDASFKKYGAGATHVVFRNR